VRRRDFISAATAALISPLVARADQRDKRIGFLSAYPEVVGKELVGCFSKGLAESGWIEGRNITIDYRWVGGKSELYRLYAAELVALKPDLIACNSTPAAEALQRATTDIPVLFMSVSDPVASGIVASLAHPQGNLTGLSNYLAATAGKLLELFKTVNPGLTRTVVLYDHDNPGKVLEAKELQAVSAALGLAIELPDIRNGKDIAEAISTAAQVPGTGIMTLVDGVTNSSRDLIIRLTTELRLPVISETREFVAAGGLMAYGLDFCDHFRRAAGYADKILKGAKPADLPVELPTKFMLTINLKTAKMIGVRVPPTMLSLADEIIE